MPIPAIVNRAGAWFLDSGIQEPVGGVARYYRRDLEENHLISTEITGYGISTFLYLHALTHQDAYLAAARKAGAYLVRTAWDMNARAFPFERSVYDPQPQPLAFFFDSGIIIRGLLWLHRATRDTELLEVAAACGRAMAADFAAGSEFHPTLALPAKTPVPRDTRWSRMPGCYQLKGALGWQELFEATGDKQFDAWYEQALALALDSHASFLPGSTDPQAVMDRLHPYCYFLEGLLPRLYQHRPAAVLREGIARVGESLRRFAPEFVRSDVYAQLLRLRLYAEAAGAAPVDRLAAEWEARQLIEFAIESLDSRIHGGFHFGRRGGDWLPHVSPASTAFALQALTMWRQYSSGELRAAYQMLI